jgi:quercetin dioxygenase-like cupin family protein/DNA-directed RNA polymerase subunit RPC12/RpoP
MKKIFLAVSVLFAGLTAGFAQDPAAAPQAKVAAPQTVNLNDIKQFDPKDMIKKVPLSADKLVFNTYFFSPRQVLKLHKHPASDELFYIVEGKGQFALGDNKFPVESGSVIYGPADVMHGLVNSGDSNLVLISVQGPKPVKTVFAEKAIVKCPDCGQENIVPEGAKEGDIVICPRCGAKFKLSKDKDGGWVGTQV